MNHIGVSRRIASAEERSRLRRLVTESKGTFPGGFIVRTAAEGAPDDEIRADVEFLGRTWEKIRTQGRAAQGSRAAASRPQPRRAHPARLRQQRLHRHLDRQRRGVRQGRRVRQPLPAQAGQPRQALHQARAHLRGVRHPAGARQGAAAQGLAQVRRLHRHQPHRSAGGHRRQHRQVRRPRLARASKTPSSRPTSKP